MVSWYSSRMLILYPFNFLSGSAPKDQTAELSMSTFRLPEPRSVELSVARSTPEEVGNPAATLGSNTWDAPPSPSTTQRNFRWLRASNSNKKTNICILKMCIDIFINKSDKLRGLFVWKSSCVQYLKSPKVNRYVYRRFFMEFIRWWKIIFEFCYDFWFKTQFLTVFHDEFPVNKKMH